MLTLLGITFGRHIIDTALGGGHLGDLETLLSGLQLANLLLLLVTFSDRNVAAVGLAVVILAAPLLSAVIALIVLHHIAVVLQHGDTLGLGANINISLTLLDGDLLTLDFSGGCAHLDRGH